MIRKTTVLAATLLLLGPALAGARPKIDVVTLRNGDRVTCEIKTLEKGKLTVSTDAMSTVEIEWEDISGIESVYYFRMTDRAGGRWFGTLSMESGSDVLRVFDGPAEGASPAVDVVGITALETSFWSRQDGSLSFGFSFTRASQVTQLTFDWANVYRTERNQWELRAQSTITDKGQEDSTTRRVDTSLGYTRLLRAKWTGTTSLSGQRNDELGLSRRLLLSAGTGVKPVRTNTSVLHFSVGLAVNAERGTDGSSTESLEADLEGSYSLFRYDTPKTDVSTSLNVYPSFTEKGRLRLEYDLKLRYEIVKDFFIDLSYYLSLDNQSASGEGEKRDTGIVTSLGWSY
jgi:hypothetical protein